MANKELAAKAGGKFLNLRMSLPWTAADRSQVDEYSDLFYNMMPNHPRAAWLLHRSAEAALLGAAVMGGARAFKWLVDAGDEDTASDPAKKIRKQLGTTFSYGSGPEERKTASAAAGEPRGAVHRPGGLNVLDTAVNVAVPAAAMILAGGLAFKAVDKAADKHWTMKTDKALSANEDIVRRLVEARARLAKGTITDEEVERVLADAGEAGYVKRAYEMPEWWNNAGAWMRDTWLGKGAERLGVALMLLTMGAGAATAAGAYRYFRKSDPGNIKYKAYERGLQEYARLKTGMTPITMSPDKEMLARIDEGAARPGEGPARGLPEVGDARKPLTLTLD